MTSKNFHIQVVDNCFLVKKSGLWSLATDLQYISALSDMLENRQGTAFYMLVDMRGLNVPEEVKFHKEKYPIILDRRNQKGEIWLQDDPKQTDHLLRYFEDVTFELKRTVHKAQFVDWLGERLAPSTMDAINTWLDKKPGATSTT